jgi:hypothetical protein
VLGFRNGAQRNQLNGEAVIAESIREIHVIFREPIVAISFSRTVVTTPLRMCCLGEPILDVIAISKPRHLQSSIGTKRRESTLNVLRIVDRPTAG